MKNMYTNERNIQMLIYLLKKENIKKVIINPGTMNMSFVASLQADDFFELYSCVDERSACYMACGLASESGEAVVLTCTGATASRNYMSGMTEAFYRKLPILAVTCTPHLGNIGQNIPQMIDRRQQQNDTCKLSVYVPPIHSSDDEWANNIALNNALLELKRHGGGPVHINLGTEVTKVFNCSELPHFRKINRYFVEDSFPQIPQESIGKIGVFVGNHNPWSKELTLAVEEFCEKYNAVVICDHTSNYFGKYKIQMSLIYEQEKYDCPFKNFNLLIHIGNVSGAYLNLKVKKVWRVHPDGEIRDTFKTLENVFEMEEQYFFNHYNQMKNTRQESSLYQNLNKEFEELTTLATRCEFPFSNVWVAQNTLKLLPECTLHLAILNTLRTWNYFDTNKKITCFCNTGGFGIDGMLSSLIGSSFYDKSKLYFGIVGDLAFFYDINSLGNRYVGKNLRIMLINNGCGTEFHNYSHPANVIGDKMISPYIAADGHFGNQSLELVKNYAESLGFQYISASTKEEFLKQVPYFTANKDYDKPIVFEVFTHFEDESNAIHKIRTLKVSTSGEIKSKLKNVLSPSTKNKIKKIMGK